MNKKKDIRVNQILEPKDIKGLKSLEKRINVDSNIPVSKLIRIACRVAKNAKIDNKTVSDVLLNDNRLSSK